MDTQKTATIMLMSGEADKALIAFMIATGFAAMGVQVKMWFTLWGANCLRRRRGLLHAWFRRRGRLEASVRRTDNDTVLQNMVDMLNRGGAAHLPLSRLNLLGLGTPIFNALLKRKSVAGLEELIRMADELGIEFTVCQICVDALALDPEDLVVSRPVAVKGVSQYMKDAMSSHYNTVI